MTYSIQVFIVVTLLLCSKFFNGLAYYTDHKFSLSRNEVHKSDPKIAIPEFRETRIRTDFYELTKEKIAQLSDENYGKGKQVYASKKNRDAFGLNSFRNHKKKKEFGCPCSNPHEPPNEACCRKIVPPVIDEWPNTLNEDYIDDEVMNDVHVHPIPSQNDLLCQRSIKDYGRVPRPRRPRERLNVLIIGDETMDFLSGTIYRGKCKVSTESYPGLTVTDARQRMWDVLKKWEVKPDKMIIHAGANDIIDELPAVTSLVIGKLKSLVDEMRISQEAGTSAKSYALSGIIPKNDPLMTFNNKVNLINSNVGWYAQKNGIEYIDHSHVFWHNGALRKDLYHFDGTLNEDGLRKVEESIFDDSVCRRNDDDFHDQAWQLRQKLRMRKRPSLELKDILPMERKVYDKHLPPKKDGQPTKVHFHVTVLSVDSIDEESMTYVADIFLAQSWQDYRLRLPENMTEGYRILDVGWLQYIWRPDSFFKNAKKVTFHDMSVPNHYLWLYYDKTLLYMAKLTLELSCAMKFEAYPHDTQNCSMMIESLSHTVDDLIFLWNVSDPLVVSEDVELPQLDIVESLTEDCTLEYSTGNFTCLAVVFNLKRRLGYHLFHTYVPTTLIVVMSWISFWIRPEAIPARVTLGVTSLLTLATQNTQSQSSLPPVSYVKAIDVWMSSCTVFVFMSLMEFAVVNHYMGYTGSSKLMRGYSVDELDKLLLQRKNGVTFRGNSFSSPPRTPNTCCDLDIALAIDRFSRFFFPFSFFILNLIYWCAYAFTW
ncbi:unnamed protein product [Larinioides sclopetarius]|uniref:Uncharacterized protein n=2 Tax=Larinioides sclopetarius TaxID=280406 RepID=A0AAV1Z3H1_9ARAC